MKRLIISLISVTLTTAAVAECEFPYYPEFADAFTKYDEVTPLLAKKVVITTRMPFAPADAVVCEPLRIRDVAGKPLGLVVPTYKGTDLKVVKKWNGLANKINTGQKIAAAEIEADLSFFRKAEYVDDFTTVLIQPYTFHGMIPGASETFPAVFAGYDEALNLARIELKTDNLFFKRIVGGGLRRVQSFEFEAGNGEEIIIGYDSYDEVRVVDPEAEKEGMRKVAEISYSSIKKLEASGKIEENIQRWKDIDRAVSDHEAAQEYARIIGLGDFDDDPIGYYLQYVPDPNQNLGKWRSSCWCYGIGGIFAYHGIFRVRYSNLKSKRPTFDDGYTLSSPTQKFAIEISNTYYGYVNVGLMEWKDFFKLAVRARQWAYDHGCNTAWRKFMFTSWAKTASSGPYEGGEIMQNNCLVPWSAIKAITTWDEPIALGDEWYYGKQPEDAHTCPCVGWATDVAKGEDYNVCFDMKDEPEEPNHGFYKPEYTWHWTTWYQKEEEYPDQVGVRMTPPGPGIEPASWVTYVKASRGEEDEVTWAVFKSQDVRGFNLYGGTPGKLGPAVNDELIPAEEGKLEYSYAVREILKQNTYVLELVRRTEDDYKMLFPEGEF
jgi:hypothetical protein